MTLLRSLFWLGVAFVVIGPQIDYSESISVGSESALASGQQFIAAQTDISDCGSIECVGGKMALSAGVRAVGDFAQSMTPLNATTSQLVSPVPHPRLARLS